MLLENRCSSTRVSGAWKIHGRGWDSTPTRGGVDQTITIHGTSERPVQPASLNTMQTWENMQVHVLKSMALRGHKLN